MIHIFILKENTEIKQKKKINKILHKNLHQQNFFSEKSNADMASNLWKNIAKETILRDTLMIEREIINTTSSNNMVCDNLPQSPLNRNMLSVNIPNQNNGSSMYI